MQHLMLKAAVAVTTDQGLFTAVISTESVDRERDIVVASAMVDALSAWPRPIPLAWEHSTKAEDIFGHIEPMTVREVDGEVIAQGQVDLETKVGQEAWRSFKNRTLGFSFGYLIPDGGAKAREGGGRYITQLDVFEITATRTPMNNDTRVLEVKATERDEPDPRELEAELVRRGVLSEPHAAQYAQAVTDVLGTENGDIVGTENGDHLGEKAYAHVREEWRNHMLNLFTPDEPKPERKTVAPTQVTTFEC